MKMVQVRCVPGGSSEGPPLSNPQGCAQECWLGWGRGDAPSAGLGPEFVLLPPEATGAGEGTVSSCTLGAPDHSPARGGQHILCPLGNPHPPRGLKKYSPKFSTRSFKALVFCF